MAERKRRAIGVTRVSQEGARQEDRLYSYDTQAEAIAKSCREQGMELLYVGQERTVSGGAELANRPELSRAVEAVEHGDADVIVTAYFDRFFRSLTVQGQVIDRIERAGGELLTLDHGQLTNGDAAQRLQANIVGAMSQYFREQGREKSRAGQARAVERGATPWARVPLGYRRVNGKLEVDPAAAPIARQAFDMRASGVSIAKIRAMLKSHGIERSFRGVQVMLASRVYLGEVRFGEHVNTEAHEAIIEEGVWHRVQGMRVPRGRQADSKRLLARLGVLRCGSCGARLSTMKLPKQNDYPIYRCPSTNDCPKHVTISAEIAERVIWEATQERRSDLQGRASMEQDAQAAAARYERAQAAYDAAMRVLDPLEPAAIERLAELRAERDAAREEDQARRNSGSAIEIDIFDPEISLDARRALIRSTIRAARVMPGGRGAERITLEFLGE
jgi:site-specific DNA recombinase